MISPITTKIIGSTVALESQIEFTSSPKGKYKNLETLGGRRICRSLSSYMEGCYSCC